MSSPVNPRHYTDGGIETIKYLEAKLSPEEFRGFIKGNVLKYLSRESRKGGDEDLAKAAWYLLYLLKRSSRWSALSVDTERVGAKRKKKTGRSRDKEKTSCRTG